MARKKIERMNTFSFHFWRLSQVMPLKINAWGSNGVGSVAAGYLRHWTKALD
jgi:hypothetical protein